MGARTLASLHGCLLGEALGDAIGLPFEQLSPRRRRRIWGDLETRELHMCLLPGRRGMISDDADHAVSTARALTDAQGDIRRFEARLRAELRAWILSLPPGIGFATLKAGGKSLLFLPRTGVFSAGNGPAMRAPILGAFFASDLAQVRHFCRSSTLLTHTDPKAEWGAFAIALAASAGLRGQAGSQEYLRELKQWSDDSPAAREVLDLAHKAADAAARGLSSAEFCAEMGWKKGISGYILHTMPAVLQAWLRRGADPGEAEFRALIRDLVLAGGDTDTIAAILGGVLGAQLGPARLPADWKAGLWEWPNSPRYIEKVACALQNGASSAPRTPWGAPLLRNLGLLGVVLAHILRRAIPF